MRRKSKRWQREMIAQQGAAPQLRKCLNFIEARGPKAQKQTSPGQSEARAPPWVTIQIVYQP
jgi:hypothetical protein